MSLAVCKCLSHRPSPSPFPARQTCSSSLYKHPKATEQLPAWYQTTPSSPSGARKTTTAASSLSSPAPASPSLPVSISPSSSTTRTTQTAQPSRHSTHPSFQATRSLAASPSSAPKTAPSTPAQPTAPSPRLTPQPQSLLDTSSPCTHAPHSFLNKPFFTHTRSPSRSLRR